MKFTKKHRLFVEAFSGDVAAAMREAGFEGAPGYLEQEGAKLLRDETIREAIRQRSRYLASTTMSIANREERQKFWSDIMRNQDPNAHPELNSSGMAKPPENIPLAMRLKASELLGKSETDFIEKIDVHHNLSLSDVIKEAYTIPNESLEAIEAEYERAYAQKKQIENNVVDAEIVEDQSLADNTFEPALAAFL